MKHNGVWVDTPFMHALACACNVDVVIWQTSGITLIGSSLHQGGKPAALVPVALLNDFHFWALVPDADDADLSLQNLSGKRRIATVVDLDDDADAHLEVPTSSFALTDRNVEAEMGLVECLAGWNPWSLPTEKLIKETSCKYQPRSSLFLYVAFSVI